MNFDPPSAKEFATTFSEITAPVMDPVFHFATTLTPQNPEVGFIGVFLALLILIIFWRRLRWGCIFAIATVWIAMSFSLALPTLIGVAIAFGVGFAIFG